jgi:hypothetical protein
MPARLDDITAEKLEEVGTTRFFSQKNLDHYRKLAGAAPCPSQQIWEGLARKAAVMGAASRLNRKWTKTNYG